MSEKSENIDWAQKSKADRKKAQAQAKKDHEEMSIKMLAAWFETMVRGGFSSAKFIQNYQEATDSLDNAAYMLQHPFEFPNHPEWLGLLTIGCTFKKKSKIIDPAFPGK